MAGLCARLLFIQLSPYDALALEATANKAAGITVLRTAPRRHPGLRLQTSRPKPIDATVVTDLPAMTVARTIVDVATSGRG